MANDPIKGGNCRHNLAPTYDNKNRWSRNKVHKSVIGYLKKCSKRHEFVDKDIVN
jgi:hypothetical protein